MRHPDVRISLVLLAVFAALLGYSFTLPRPRLSVGVGPAFVPQLVLTTLLGLTLVLLVKAWVQARREAASTGEEERGRRHLYGMLLAVGFVLLMGYVGTFFSIALFVAATMAVAGGRRPWTLAIMTLAVPLAIYLLFTMFLSVQFPAEWAF